MPGNWLAGLVAGLNTVNQILSAGIAITAFSLLLYSLTFNLRDQVARAFALILGCVVLVFTSKAIGSSVANSPAVGFWLRLQWVGIIFLPSTYLHFSDALLATTGRPSRGRRRWAIRFTYLISFILLVTLPFSNLVGPVVVESDPAPYLQRTILTDAFTLYYASVMVLAWINFARAYFRTTTRTTRRRMVYLLGGATAPAIGSYPFLLLGPGIAAAYPTVFWILATVSNLLVSVLVVVMAYAVAFFGVSWPDRVVKSRLFKWLMRGPVTASFALTFTTLVRRAGAVYGVAYSALVPIVMVGTILLFEFMITLLSPLWDRWLFFGKDREELNSLQDIGDRLLTRNDLRQFLEMVLATVCDRLQISTAFIAAMNGNGLELVVQTGDDGFLDDDAMSAVLTHAVTRTGIQEETFRWGNYLLIPLHSDESGDEPVLVGVLGASQKADQEFDEEQMSELSLLSRRAALALQDRHLQQQVLQSLKTLTPQVEYIQRLRAATRYDSMTMLADEELLPQESLIQWVRDALTHYWGGPRLTESPLLQLQVVKAAVHAHEGNPSNALRAILREAIDRIRPEGERRFTGEWILYNILEMKFLEGRKVREIAMRLAMSEADLYRKQRVALEAVAKTIMEMEEQARQEVAKT